MRQLASQTTNIYTKLPMSTPYPPHPSAEPGDGVHSLGFAVGIGIGGGCLLLVFTVCCVMFYLARKTSASLDKGNAEAPTASNHQHKDAQYPPAYDEIGGAPPQYSPASSRADSVPVSVPMPAQAHLRIIPDVEQAPTQVVEGSTSPPLPTRSPSRLHRPDVQSVPALPNRSPLRKYSCDLPRPTPHLSRSMHDPGRATSFELPRTSWQAVVMEPFAFIL